jgi:hypothetical protein
MRSAQKYVGIGVAVFLLASPAFGQELKAVGEIRSEGPVTSEVSKKIGSRLRGLIADFQGLGIAGGIGAAQRFSSDTLKVDNAGRVQIYVHVNDTSEQALDTLRRHGLDIEVVNDDFGIVQGWIPVANLNALAAEPVVVKVRPPSYATHNTGPVTSQGDSIHRCDQARSVGFNGAGIKVGVVSDGVSGLSVSQAAGELGPVQILSAGSGDEGTAMLEIVADCAPGAALAFAASATSLDFIQAVNALQSAGAQIIVDDVAFVTEPIFEDGPVALNDRTVGATVLRVSAAGNFGLGHYMGTFSPGTFDAQVSGTRHNFGGGDELLRFQVPGGALATIFLQWSDRFGAAADDYDLCIRSTNGSLLGCSAIRQNGSDDPLEVISLPCSAPAGSFCLADIQVTRFSGATQTLALFLSPCMGCQFIQFNNRQSSVFGHAGVPEVLAVAATNWNTPTIVEPYSSAGPTTILFPSVQSRAKPDLTGVDCVATSRPAPFNPFCGTSAAAPHVGAVAAILLQRMGPGTTVQALAGALKATATDLGAPGFDSDFGAGRADALTAVQSPLRGGYDGDGKADIAVYRSSTGRWFIQRSSDGLLADLAWGCPSCGDIAVPADYDGDGKADIAVYRNSTGEWFIRRSSDGGLTHLSWGCPSCGDTAVPADYNSDGKADIAVYRRSTGEWFIQRSSDGGLTHLAWGCPSCGDIAVSADYDGDGKADIAVYRRSTGEWFIQRSSDGGLTQLTWGCPSCDDVAVPADYDGDGKADIAVYRRSTGEWFIQRSSDGGLTHLSWGCPSCGDIAVPADYNGDGKADIAVYRSSTGEWFIQRSSDGQLTHTSWGCPACGDVAVPRD